MSAHALGITDFWTYVAGVIFIVLLPGPNSMYVLSAAARRGVRIGYQAACGVFVGDTVLMVLAAAGAASLLRANPLLFSVVKYSGAAYLLYLGINMLRGAWQRARAPGASAQAEQKFEPEAVDDAHLFKRALTISLLNPKAILFLLSFFVQFVDPTYAHPVVPFLVLGVIVQLFSFTYLSTLIFSGARLAEQFRRRRKLAAGATGLVGGLFVSFSVKLALASMG
jgi:leucine efflux protein